MMIVFVLLIFSLDCYLYHDYDQVISVLLNHVCLLKHYPGSNYHVELAVHLLRRPVLRLVVNLFDCSTANKAHRMQLLAFAIAVNEAVPGLLLNLAE